MNWLGYLPCFQISRRPKNNSETVATDQLSSLDNDIFSKIPDHIIHCILDFLPSVKEVVRTSSISKSWLQAWRTYPISEFNQFYFISRSEQQFIRFVDNTLERFERQNNGGMNNFNLSTDMAHHAIRWIGIALDSKIEHLALRSLTGRFPPRPCLMIPDRILSAYWLKSLKLGGPNICIQSFSESSRVNLPSLTSLYIIDFDNIKEQELQKLLIGCPALEKIVLLGCSLSKVDIFYHPNLETLDFSVKSRPDEHVAIRVRAPKLKSFSYCCLNIFWSCDVIVNIQNSPELKSLSISYETKTDEWFHKFIDQFPLLENLTLDHCKALKKIRISNPLLEKINIWHCHNLEDMVISSKKLTSFYLYTMDSYIPNPSIRMEMDNPPNDCTVNINNHYHGLCSHLMETSWYCKLKDFLTRPFTFKRLRIDIFSTYTEDGDMNGEDVQKKLPHAACNIEKLSMFVCVPSSCYPHILNGLLSTCHPNTIELDCKLSNLLFCKFLCEEFGNSSVVKGERLVA